MALGFTSLWIRNSRICRFNKIDHVMQEYGVPNEVYARMGPLAMPSIRPTKTIEG